MKAFFFYLINNMLRKIRIAFATAFFMALTLLFLDFTGSVHAYLGWCAKIQLVPALLASFSIAVLCTIFLTLVFGRIYCSTICPLGIFQDIVYAIKKKIRKKEQFEYKKQSKAIIAVRYSLLVLFILPIVLGLSGRGIVMFLDPYSAFGRIASLILGPFYKFGNNLLAGFAERIDSYAFYSTDILLKGSFVLAIAILTLAAIIVFAYKSGRGYCNTICPVGTFLGLLTKYAFIKPRLDNSKCGLCALCVKNCKASCIDIVTGKIDSSRCVSCFNCLSVCRKNAITYSRPLKTKLSNEKEPELQAESLSEKGLSKRNMLSGSALILLSSALDLQAHRPADGGLAELVNKKSPNRTKPLVPAGAGSFKNFHDKCTGCQLCASVCPNQVLSPVKTKPVMSFERGYCRPECVKCSEVCPTGAIKPVTRAEKSSTQIGYAIWNPNLCIVNADKVVCDLCSRKCPTAAITMISQNANDQTSPKIPMIDTERCIGCGACEHLCPSRPQSAIYVEGIEIHRAI